MPAACQCAKLPRLLKSGLHSIWGGKIKLIYSFLSLDCHSKFQEGKWANESWSVQLHWAPHNQSFPNQLGLSFHNFHVLKAFCLKFCVCGHVHPYCGTLIFYSPVSIYLHNYKPFSCIQHSQCTKFPFFLVYLRNISEWTHYKLILG